MIKSFIPIVEIDLRKLAKSRDVVFDVCRENDTGDWVAFFTKDDLRMGWTLTNDPQTLRGYKSLDRLLSALEKQGIVICTLKTTLTTTKPKE